MSTNKLAMEACVALLKEHDDTYDGGPMSSGMVTVIELARAAVRQTANEQVIEASWPLDSQVAEAAKVWASKPYEAINADDFIEFANHLKTLARSADAAALIRQQQAVLRQIEHLTLGYTNVVMAGEIEALCRSVLDPVQATRSAAEQAAKEKTC